MPTPKFTRNSQAESEPTAAVFWQQMDTLVEFVNKLETDLIALKLRVELIEKQPGLYK
jgi:hypothetical protein